MNPLRLAALALLFISGMANGWANLGETEAQCVARYGPETAEQDNLGFDVIGDKAATFNLKTAKASLVMNVIFLNGRDAHEKITKADTSQDISEDQKRAILDSESAGFTWSEKASTYRTDRSDNTMGAQHWLRSDGATAICWMSGKLKVQNGWDEIDFSTKEYAAAQRDLDRQNGSG
jgi:hypothetical protein